MSEDPVVRISVPAAKKKPPALGRGLGALMGETVNCPALGPIGRDRCLAWQKKPFSDASSIRVQVYRACRAGCVHSKLKEQT